MKKKTIRSYVIAAALLLGMAALLGACGSSESEAPQWPAMDQLTSVAASDISSIKYLRSTEGGVEGDTVTDATQIEDIYLRLKEVAITGESEMAVDDDGLSLGVTVGDETIGFAFEGDILVLDGGKRYEVENLSSLKGYIDGLVAKKAAEDAKRRPTEKPDKESSDEAYDIEKGASKRASESGDIVYIYFNDFMMIMPNNDKYSYEASGDSVTFSLWSAQQEGYGGKLVTIKAYDMDDDSYKDLPSYHVAGVGKNVNKRFIAIYPTDVQWNTEDATQTADYKDLSTYLEKIGEGAVNSPLKTADSSDEE